MENKEHYLKIFLLVGLGIGILSSLPVFAIGNCCCMWELAGGFLAGWLLCRWASNPVNYGEGALVGAFSGILAGVIFSFLQALKLYLNPASFKMAFQRSFEFRGIEPPPELERFFDQFSQLLAHPFYILLAASFFYIIIFAIMTTLGSLLGVLVFEPRFAQIRPKRVQIKEQQEQLPDEEKLNSTSSPRLYFPRKKKEGE